MTKEEIQEQGRLFFEASITHQQVDPPVIKYPDMTFEESYAVQRVFIGLLEKKHGFHISGKKVGLTSKAMREASNIHEPDYGYIWHEWSWDNESELPMENFIAPRIECELAFKLKADLDQEVVTREEVLNATEYVVACLEIVDFRMFRDKVQRRVQDSIADDAAFGGYVLGDKPIDPRKVDLTMVPFAFEVNNRQVEVSCGAAVLNDPCESVAWLANTFREKMGDPLRKGEIILAGSAVASYPAARGDHFRCRYDAGVGEVSCRFV